MATLNQCSFIGHLGKDPDLQVTSEGKPYTRFSLAVNQGKDQTMWLNVTTWEKLTETVERYAHKGTQVFVQGRLQLRPYKDKNGVERQAVDLVASIVQILDKKQDNGTATTEPIAGGDPFLPEGYTDERL
jgi:single-strand DNA-binding protein